MDYDDLRKKYKYLKTAREARKTLGEIKDIFKDNRETFDDADVDNLLSSPPEKPSFPIFILTAALIKDVIDVVDITGVGAIVTTVFSLILAVILFVWCLGKLSGGWWKRALIRWLWTVVIIAIFIEMIPVVKMIPANTIFILMAYYKEKKIVKLLNLALEKMHKAGFTKRII